MKRDTVNKGPQIISNMIQSNWSLFMKLINRGIHYHTLDSKLDHNVYRIHKHSS